MTANMINELTPEWWTDYAMAMLFFCLIFANGSAFVLMLRINSGGKPAAEQPGLTLWGIQPVWHSLKTELILYPFTKQQGGVLAALSLTGLYSVSINPNGSPHSLRSCSRHTAEPFLAHSAKLNFCLPAATQLLHPKEMCQERRAKPNCQRTT
jgi:hypothetical protein